MAAVKHTLKPNHHVYHTWHFQPPAGVKVYIADGSGKLRFQVSAGSEAAFLEAVQAFMVDSSLKANEARTDTIPPPPNEPAE